MLSAEERQDIEIIKCLPQPISSKALMTPTLAEDPVSMFNGELGSVVLNFVFLFIMVI